MSKMLNSLAQQSYQPIEMIVVDASSSTDTEQICRYGVPGLQTRIIYEKATTAGAAAQRNQAVKHCKEKTALFLDDDIIFEPECIALLWKALQSDTHLGGVNAMIVNQRYSPPGYISRALFRLLDGTTRESYAGRCIGPACNLLPEDDPKLPSVVPVEWLNTTCTLYRHEALPSPPFDSMFTGYSMLEDLTLSLRVGRKWRLANARTARIFHDSQPGEHKKRMDVLAKMELVNRHYVMTRVMGRVRLTDYLKLMLLELFGVVTPLASLRNWQLLLPVLAGKIRAIGAICSSRDKYETVTSSMQSR